MSNLVVNIYCLVFTIVLASSSSGSQADKLPSPPIPPFLQEFFSSNPIFAWIFWLFTALAIGAAAIATFTGNLQKIIDFFKSNLLRKPVEVSESQSNRLRRQLLGRLQSDIAIRRKNSLHNLVKIDLEMEEQRHRVGGKTVELAPQEPENNHPLNRVFRFFKKDNQQTTQLKQSQKIIEFFERDDIQGKLLILGEPGAGKTTEMLSLTEDLIQRAIEKETAPIPVIFELSSWKNDQPIRDWLIEKLCDIYKGIPKKVAQQWIDEQQLIPLLDGLDELGLENENKCIVAINKFLDSSFQPGLVVCCRREEYEQAETKLEELNGAIYLESLSDKQIQGYLKSLKRSYIWDENIRNESELLELCRQPLFLTILVVAYQGRSIKNSSELFESYIEQQLNNLDNQGTYALGKNPAQQKTLHYLVWLAKKLENDRETEFLIEGMQPHWLESIKQKTIYRIIVGLIFGVIFGINEGLTIEWIAGLNNQLLQGQSIGLISGLNVGLIAFLIVSLIGGLNVGFNLGLIFVLIGDVWGVFIYEIIFGIIFNQNRFKIITIKPTEKINWSFRKFMKTYRAFLLFGSMIGLIVGLVFSLIKVQLPGLTGGSVFWLIFWPIIFFLGGLIIGLVYGVFGGFKSSVADNKNYPNQGIWNSLSNGLMVGLIFGLTVGIINELMSKLYNLLNGEQIVGLIFGRNVGLITGISTILMFGLIFGLGIVIQHFALRIIIYQNGNIPWNYAKFLDHAAKHRFIQRVGGRYRFMHDLLRKHFAQMPIN